MLTKIIKKACDTEAETGILTASVLALSESERLILNKVLFNIAIAKSQYGRNLNENTTRV